MYEAWGKYVVSCVTDRLNDQISPLSADVFLRLPPKARTKRVSSFLEKAFYRNKNYEDPYNEITDKVGVRFVVLLTTDIRTVEDAISTCPVWDAVKDRDFEKEHEANPIQFDYAAIHYVVRCRDDLITEEVAIKKGTPCEIQVKTILQHAYSELTHDTIYKPRVDATSGMRRAAAKSMALIEATNDYFEQVSRQVGEMIKGGQALSERLSKVYRVRVGLEPELSRTEGLILEAYENDVNEDLEASLLAFLEEKSFVADRVSAKAKTKLLYRQPSILLVYMLAAKAPAATKDKWPLTPNELKPVYVDIGLNFESI